MTSRTKWLGQFPFGPYSPECVERPFAEACLNRGKLEIEAQSRCRNRRSPMRGRLQQQPPLTPAPQHSPLVGDRLPHHLGPLDDQLRRPVFLRAYLPNAHTQRVVEPAVTLILAEVSRAYYYLPPTDRVGPAVASVVEEDLRPSSVSMTPWKSGRKVPSLRRLGWLAPRNCPEMRPSAKKKNRPSTLSGPARS